MTAPLLLSGSANPSLGNAIARALGVAIGACLVDRFPDGEIQIELRSEVRGRDVYLLQPTRPPAGEYLLEMVLLADAARRSGARRVTAVMPYFGYARQDRRVLGREPLGARAVADLIAAAGIDRVVALDLHSATVEGCFRLPLEHVSAVKPLAQRVRELEKPSVVVSPDLGAVKLAERYARELDLPVAVVHKQRLSGSEVSARAVVGAVKGATPLVVDDMISTAGTMSAAVEALLEAGCMPEVTLCASHGLFVGPAMQRLSALPLRRVVTTDSVPAPQASGLPLEVVSVAPVLAEAISRLSQA
ncbi:MAG: ribose-phosphate pyrophosphokinase [Myxococcales bacterium]|nr:ribose-phosphate pyrophosphokinase [Myxococcales bacterium]